MISSKFVQDHGQEFEQQEVLISIDDNGRQQASMNKYAC